ncbi:MAG: hypothetical protein IJQ44_05925 [Bacteroidaceae bacterium]|nr:hypothetical protein [Bacteroidaceae bacterium]
MKKKDLTPEAHDCANVANVSSLYPSLVNTQQIDIDGIPSSKLQPILKALVAYNAAAKRASKAEESANVMREKLEYELTSVFGDDEFALYTQFPSKWGKEFCITYGGYFLLRKKEITRRVIDRDALRAILQDRYNLCFKKETARGTLQTGPALEAIIEKKMEKKPKTPEQ